MSTTRSKAATSKKDVGTQFFHIGENLRVKGFYDDAILELNKSYKLREREFGMTHVNTMKVNYSLGLCYSAKKQYQDALHHLTVALTTLEELQEEEEEENEQVNATTSGTTITTTTTTSSRLSSMMEQCKISIARTLHRYGLHFQHTGRHDLAISQHCKSLELKEELFGKDHLETARTYYALGCAYCVQGRYDQALTELRRTLRIRVARFENDDHIDVLEVLDDINTVIQLRASTQLQASSSWSSTFTLTESQLDELERRSAKIGNLIEDGLTAIGLPGVVSALGASYLIPELSSFASSSSQQQQQQQQQQQPSSSHSQPSSASASSASSSQQLSQPRPHEDYHTIALKSVNYELEGDANFKDKDYDQAMTDYHFALGLEENWLGALHPSTSDLYLKVANALAHMGDLEASSKEYQAAIAIVEAVEGRFHPKVARIFIMLAQVLEENGEYTASLSFYAKAYMILDSTLVGNHPDTIRCFKCIRDVAKLDRQARAIKRAQKRTTTPKRTNKNKRDVRNSSKSPTVTKRIPSNHKHNNSNNRSSNNNSNNNMNQNRYESTAANSERRVSKLNKRKKTKILDPRRRRPDDENEPYYNDDYYDSHSRSDNQRRNEPRRAETTRTQSRDSAAGDPSLRRRKSNDAWKNQVGPPPPPPPPPPHEMKANGTRQEKPADSPTCSTAKRGTPMTQSEATATGSNRPLENGSLSSDKANQNHEDGITGMPSEEPETTLIHNVGDGESNNNLPEEPTIVVTSVNHAIEPDLVTTDEVKGDNTNDTVKNQLEPQGEAETNGNKEETVNTKDTPGGNGRTPTAQPQETANGSNLTLENGTSSSEKQEDTTAAMPSEGQQESETTTINHVVESETPDSLVTKPMIETIVDETFEDAHDRLDASEVEDETTTQVESHGISYNVSW